MQINRQVPNYNFSLIAHAIGQLAAELGDAIGSKFPSNEIKARYLTSLLIGPIFQSFDGVPGASSSGLTHNAAGTAVPFVNQVFELIKPIAQTSVQLMGAPSRDYNDLKKALASKVQALRAFLDQNAPQDRKLVQGGPDFPAAQAGGAPKAPAVPLAGDRRGP
jgi:hypothetical protein